jgi:hypothetical protein
VFRLIETRAQAAGVQSGGPGAGFGPLSNSISGSMLMIA